jgi:hypothetical protein
LPQYVISIPFEIDLWTKIEVGKYVGIGEKVVVFVVIVVFVYGVAVVVVVVVVVVVLVVVHSRLLY